MAAKYQLITELYRRTGVAVAKNPQAWQGTRRMPRLCAASHWP